MLIDAATMSGAVKELDLAPFVARDFASVVVVVPDPVESLQVHAHHLPVLCKVFRGRIDGL